MDALLAALVAQGSPGVHLGVNPANTKAVGFYLRLGFVEVGSGGAVMMARRLR